MESQKIVQTTGWENSVQVVHQLIKDESVDVNNNNDVARVLKYLMNYAKSLGINASVYTNPKVTPKVKTMNQQN